MNTQVISIEEQLKQRLALQSKALQVMSGGQNYISFKGGQIIVDNQVVPGGEMDVIILGVLNERTYYADAYNPDVAQTPSCYSYNGELPHAEARDAQHTNCKGCPQDAWGSARQGKGKACRENARLALVSANADLDTATIYTAKIPISSLSTVKEFVSKAATAGKLVGQYIVKVIVKPDPKSFFKVTLMAIGENKNDIGVILSRTADAEGILNTPYPVFEEQTADVPVGKDGKRKY